MADHPIDPRDDEPYGEPPQRVTLSGKPAEPGTENEGAPAPIDPATGMHKDYWVLSKEERARGFVEPLRNSYKHVGLAGPNYPLRDLTDAERLLYAELYVKYEAYPENHQSAAVGRFWSQAQIDTIGHGCGTVTTMGTSLAETYARQPSFYGSTFCAGCKTHFPVGEDGEFTWTGTNQRVGTRKPARCPTCPGNDVDGHKFSCATAGINGGQIKLPVTLTDGKLEVAGVYAVGPTKDPDTRKGLYNKYTVTRVDGDPTNKHEGCDYFVLDLVHDPHAMIALISYASSVRDTHPQLAKDLKARIKKWFDE